MKKNKALLVVDVQNDFCPGGALPVTDGDKTVPVLNKYIKIFSKKKLPVFASRDWHPRTTKHFKKYGGKWPSHCVQRTKGARFRPALKLPKNVIIISKGMDPGRDGYSAFHAASRGKKPFLDLLKKLGIEELYIGGLATDYCVKWSVLDALRSGFSVKLLTDAIKGVNVKPKDSEKSAALMVRRGARKVTYSKIVKAG
ncbi:MAG: nicotinamidase [Candidatus Omnitrophota bacterium]